MADTKISGLAAVTDVLATDEFVLARAGATNKIDASDLAAGFGLSGGFTAWTPTLTASTTSPTLGSGSSATGMYFQLGDLTIAWGKIVFGTSGVAAGSGSYRFSVPVSSTAADAWAAGVGFAFDNSATTGRVCAVNVSNTNYVNLWADGQTNLVTNAVPWTWAASDQIVVLMVYEAA